MSGIGRASALIGAGTLVSRVTGLLRTIVLVTAIGAIGRASDAFTIANQLPNNVYAVISTGLLSAVVVPQIVKAAAHADGGRSFISKLFTLGTVALLATTVLATLAAPWLVHLYAPRFTGDQLALATTFAYWCLPQILFYGLYALLGEILNARKVYGPFTWAPIVNNLVSIAGFLLFIVLFGGSRSALAGWTPEMAALLGGTATLGIVAQAALLLFFWRRAGLSLRPDFQWRGVGLRHIGRLAGWTFLMVLAGQLAGLFQSRVLSTASGEFAANTVIANAWLIFMLPYSVIVLSIGTPYFTRLSEHAHAGNRDAVRADVDSSIRTLGIFVVLAAAALTAASVPASRIFTDSVAEAENAAPVLIAFLAGLVPLAVLFVVQRTFYAFDDTRTPFFFTIVQCTLVVLTALAVQWLLPPQALAAGVAIGQSFASLVQVIIATVLLRRRLGGLRVRSWVPALLGFSVAAVPAGFAGWATYLFVLGGISGWTTRNALFGAIGTVVIGGVCAVVYLGFLALFRVPELAAVGTVVRRLRRRG